MGKDVVRTGGSERSYRARPPHDAPEEEHLKYERRAAELRYRRSGPKKPSLLIPPDELIAAYEEANYRLGETARLLGVKKRHVYRNMRELAGGEPPPLWRYPPGTLHCNMIGWHIAFAAGQLQLYRNPLNIVPLANLVPVMCGTDIRPMLELMQKEGELDTEFVAMGKRYIALLREKARTKHWRDAQSKRHKEWWASKEKQKDSC